MIEQIFELIKFVTESNKDTALLESQFIHGFTADGLKHENKFPEENSLFLTFFK